MLFNAIKKLLLSPSPKRSFEEQEASFSHGESFQNNNEYRKAVVEYRKHLERFPHDIGAINNLAVCLDELCDDGAGELFELALSLDDTYHPALVNHARYLVGKQRIDDGLRYLLQAKVHSPEDVSTLVTYALIAQKKGDAEMGRRYVFKAWLGMFDVLRGAGCFLFNSAYVDIDEALLAAEHRFWAETALPLPASDQSKFSSASYDEEITHASPVVLPAKGSKIRIAYWSPDFRNHSVRYFALPLLENHDREQFEVIAYHDSMRSDERTDAIKKCCDFFVSVGEISDEQLSSMMRSHQLDILVELAGHTSANRINLLQQRLAAHQLTGIGYPPTTGLDTFDGKFLDKYIVTADSARYYTEPPLVLESFWCFDPKEEPEICMEPPAKKNGYITFACAGNIAKISRPIVECWAKILERVSSSRLQIRSLGFEDEAAVRFISEFFQQAGLDMARVDLMGPATGAEFFASYNDVDIILDTYPFNGGTTTCFATYMGVPVLSLAGKSLLSRMGMSIMSNLGLSSWIASSYEEYIEKAVLHAGDIESLSRFRSEARSLYASSALGNGKLFARDFEKHCFELMKETERPPRHQVAALPAEELVSRIFEVIRYGQFDSAQRIVDHCLREYPNCGAAHVLWTARLTRLGKFAEAIAYLEDRLAGFSQADQFTALLNIARFNILLNHSFAAEGAIHRMAACVSNSLKDQLYLRMLQAYLTVIKSADNDALFSVVNHVSMKRVFVVLIVCDDQIRFSEIKNKMHADCIESEDISVCYVQCSEKNRWLSYREYLQDEKNDFVIVIQKNVEVRNKNIFSDIAVALEQYDVVSIGGAKSWDRLDWRHSSAENKAMSFLVPSGELNGFCEISYSGHAPVLLVGGMAVLDGGFFAIKTAGLRLLEIASLFDPMLEGGGTLQEEYFTNALANAGLALGVHQNLGVVLDWRMEIRYDNVEDARWHITEKMSFDPFMEDGEDRAVFSISLPSTEQAIQIMGHFLKQ